MEYYSLNNGVKMPTLIQGIPLAGPNAGMKYDDFVRIVYLSIDCGVRAFDTSAAYGPSEEVIGKIMPMLNREEIFITTKISNAQQEKGNIEECVDKALRLMRTDYIDCMLLHWPYPGYIENYIKLEKEYQKGKLRSIGLANAQIRHIEKLKQNDITILPHIIQTEIHPFRTEERFLQKCKENGIVIQACSSLMGMRPMLSRNNVLKQISEKYGKTISQIVLRWHVQRGIAPVFRSFNEHHLRQSTDIFGFVISEEDMSRIMSLNMNYRLHPESMNCPGY